MEASSSSGKVDLPAGWAITAGIETSQLNAHSQVVQGMRYSLTGPNGTTSTVFVPYSELEDIPKVQQLIDKRINALRAISG